MRFIIYPNLRLFKVFPSAIAIDVEKKGIPDTAFLLPSIGSTIRVG